MGEGNKSSPESYNFSLFLNYLPLEIGWGTSFEQTLVFITQECFVPSLVEIGPAVLEKIFKFRQCIFAISKLSPLGKGQGLHLNKLESPSPKDALCKIWLKLAQWFWRRRFLNLGNVFSLFCNYLPMEKVGSSIWTNLNPLHPKMYCANFGWNGPVHLEIEDFLDFINVFSLLLYITNWNLLYITQHIA